jgi:hypothetical protein
MPDTKTCRRIGVPEVAAKFHCHPMTVPRLVKQRRIPPPDKILNKNTWFEDTIDELVERGLPPPPRA